MMGIRLITPPTPSPFCIVRCTSPLPHSNHLARLVLSTENTPFVPTTIGGGNPRFSSTACVENNRFNGFSLTMCQVKYKSVQYFGKY
jgi:hypothetical protein